MGSKLLDALVALVTRRPLVAVFLCLLFIVPVARHAPDLQFYNKIDFYFESDDEKLQQYHSFVKNFQVREVVALFVDMGDVFTDTNLNLVRSLTELIEAHPKIASVSSLSNFRAIEQVQDEIQIKGILPKQEHFSDAELVNLKTKLMANEFVNGKLVVGDGRYALLAIELNDFKNDNEKYEILGSLTKKIRAKLDSTPVKPYFTGVPLLESEIEHIVGEDNQVFRILIVVVIGIIVFFAIRDPWLTSLLVLNIGLAATWVLGLLYLTDEPMNTVTVIITPTMLAIAVMDGLHVVTHILKLKNDTGREMKWVVGTAIRELAFPCLMTFITTVFGYLANLATNVRPTKIVGVYTSLGLTVGYVLTLVFLPSMILLTHKGIVKERLMFARLSRLFDFMPSFETIARWVVSHKRSVTAFTVVFVVTLFAGIAKIRVDTNFETYLPEANPIRADLIHIGNHIGKNAPFEVVVAVKDKSNGFDKPETLAALRRLQDDIADHYRGTEIESSWGVTDYLRILSKNFSGSDKLPATTGEIQELMDIGDQTMLDRALTADRTQARLTFFGKFSGSKEKSELQAFISDTMTNKYNDQFSVIVTGMPMLYNWLGDSIITGEIQSFSVALLLIVGCMWCMCRTLRLTLISLIPNIIPICAVFGLMGWLNIPLETSTAMIACIMLGLVVDDTIHYLHWYSKFRREGQLVEDAIVHAFMHTGRAAFFSCIVLAGGFSVLMFSDALPTFYFGLLTTLSIMVALCGDLFILPVCLMAFDRDAPKAAGPAKTTAAGQPHLVEAEAADSDGQTAKALRVLNREGA